MQGFHKGGGGRRPPPLCGGGRRVPPFVYGSGRCSSSNQEPSIKHQAASIQKLGSKTLARNSEILFFRTLGRPPAAPLCGTCCGWVWQVFKHQAVSSEQASGINQQASSIKQQALRIWALNMLRLPFSVFGRVKSALTFDHSCPSSSLVSTKRGAGAGVGVGMLKGRVT